MLTATVEALRIHISDPDNATSGSLDQYKVLAVIVTDIVRSLSLEEMDVG